MQQDRNGPRGRRERGLTARSVLLSLLLGNDPPRASVRALVRTAELFGIADGAARTALSRMAAAGEVRAVDGRYELAAVDLLERRDRQATSRAARTEPWETNRWIQALVTGGPRLAVDRATARHQLVRARLGELREGVWLRPDNLGGRPDLPIDLEWFHVVPLDDPAGLAARLWDLDGWAGRSTELLADMDRLLAPLAAGDHTALADGFVTSADVLRHFQADPLLPSELLPADWSGGELRRSYAVYDAAYRDALAGWFDP